MHAELLPRPGNACVWALLHWLHNRCALPSDQHASAADMMHSKPHLLYSCKWRKKWARLLTGCRRPLELVAQLALLSCACCSASCASAREATSTQACCVLKPVPGRKGNLGTTPDKKGRCCFEWCSRTCTQQAAHAWSDVGQAVVAVGILPQHRLLRAQAPSLLLAGPAKSAAS